MALLGWSLILASVVYIAIRRPPLIDTLIALCWPSPNRQYPPPREGEAKDEVTETNRGPAPKSPTSLSPEVENAVPKPADINPPIPVFNIASSPSSTPSSSPQTTPKVRAATVSENSKESANGPIPSFSLSSSSLEPPASAAALARASSNSPTPTFSSPSSTIPPPTMSMPPPPRPPKLNDIRTPSSSSLLGVPQTRPSPLPSRQQQYDRQPGTSTLAPPPTHSTKPSKPSRKVTLEPGHSPLDWARLANHPTADLRGLGPNAAYLRVTPSMLRRQTGRRGKDAWTALGGRVYNITPYLPFHPGGEPELLRAAGRDGTKLFGEIHPWVNYETMLSSCLVGLLVEEAEAQSSGDMEAMD
ncbi:hypothetical protein RRF57_010564 [Xylaria bambusicola]|uniref:Cytochrome b5 heme-binding domain-containing protein n=1 Tax=Xylaria bambusicola TaxID=326684 RepID=A0AAN7ZCN8_9PEZI